MKYIIMHTLQKIIEWIHTEIIKLGRVYSAPLQIFQIFPRFSKYGACKFSRLSNYLWCSADDFLSGKKKTKEKTPAKEELNIKVYIKKVGKEVQ